MALRLSSSKKKERIGQERSEGRTITESDEVIMLVDKTLKEEEQPEAAQAGRNDGEVRPEPDSEDILPEPDSEDILPKPDSENILPKPDSEDIPQEPDSEDILPDTLPEEEEKRVRPAASAGGKRVSGEVEKAGGNVTGDKMTRQGSFRRGTGKKKGTLILTGIILDGTISITSVFPAVYYVLEELMTHMRAQAKDYRGVTFKYGLTILHDHAESVMFPGETFFTEDENLIRKAVNNMEFYGGSEDGRENLNEALREQLLRQNEYEPEEFEKVYRGVIMFSDSVSNEQDMDRYDFSTAYLDPDRKIVNHGVRFAQFYTFEGDYLPGMRMVDRKGRQTDNEKNIAVAIDIRELINGGEEKVTDEVKSIAYAILKQTSVAS